MNYVKEGRRVWGRKDSKRWVPDVERSVLGCKGRLVLDECKKTDREKMPDHPSRRQVARSHRSYNAPKTAAVKRWCLRSSVIIVEGCPQCVIKWKTGCQTMCLAGFHAYCICMQKYIQRTIYSNTYQDVNSAYPEVIRLWMIFIWFFTSLHSVWMEQMLLL